MARVVGIGAGLGGLATAIRLQAAGHRVTLVEALAQPGGRAGRIQTRGYTFDLGPTIVTAPRMLRNLWAAAGRALDDYVQLVPLDPWYEIRFRDGVRFAYGGADASAMERQVAALRPDDVDGYRRFMQRTAAIYERGFEDLAREPFLSVGKFASVIPELLRLGAHRSVYSFVSDYLRDEHLRVVFSFHPLFIGGNPFRASAIYSIVPYLERKEGVWYVKGGTYALVEAMERLFRELGGEVICGDGVVQIITGHRAVAGVRLASGAELPADGVVSNADVTNTYRRLIPAAFRRWNSNLWLRHFGHSMSCYILYLGLDRQYPHLHQHTILMPSHYREVVDAIFGGRLREDDLAVYLHMPTRTDPSLAPPGGETLYALVPVPNLAGRLVWPEAEGKLRRLTLDLLREQFGMDDVEEHIVVEHSLTPLDFRDRLDSHLGSGFSIEPTLVQSAFFRPHNRSEDVEGLYLVGAGTHPGAGLPGVLASAEIAAKLVTEDWPVGSPPVEARAR